LKTLGSSFRWSDEAGLVQSFLGTERTLTIDTTASVGSALLLKLGD
jgi:hypothetical protein